MTTRLRAVLLCISIATLAGAQTPPAAGTPGRGGRVDTFGLLYTAQCAACHGDALQGGRAGSLLDDVWTYGSADESILQSIREGRADAGMPAFKSTLSDVQQRGLLLLIRERAVRAKGRPATVATPVVDGVIKSERHNIKLETITDALETPWALAFLPDGKLLVTERPGRLRIIEKGKLLPDAVGGVPAVWTRQDGGLFDVEAHPNYARNGWIYLSYAEQRDANRSMTTIVRGRIKENQWVDQELLYRSADELFTTSNIHYGSRFIFDRQGYLYYSIGDRGRPESAQDLSLPTGKVHRIHDDGRIPNDNPFVKQAGALGSVWSYGHRNPQGFFFHPVTGKLWETEHGPRGGDEVNIVEKGHNYGWPRISYGFMDGTGMPTETTALDSMDQPVAHYEPSPGICPILVYNGNRFPNWKGSVLVGVMGHEELKRLTVDGSKVVKQEVVFKGLGRVRDIVLGPDGYLYLALANPGASLSANSPGRVVRVTPVP